MNANYYDVYTVRLILLSASKIKLSNTLIRGYEKFLDYEKRAKSVYITKLWNGQYLHYDSSTNVHHDSIMADMMAGKGNIRVKD